MRAWCMMLLLLISTAALAQGQRRRKLGPLPAPPPPPAMPGGPGSPEEPAVNIPVPQGHEVEGMREGGRVVALRVTTPGGKVYSLVDTTGNGNWIRRDSLDDGNRVPMWPIHTFD